MPQFLNARQQPVSRRGFSLPDVFVSLGVIGVLLSLLMPAVQRIRETARMVQCRDHLRQLGIASQQHCAIARGAFPYTATNGSDLRGERIVASISPHVTLMPFIDPSVKTDAKVTDPSMMNDAGSPPSFADSARRELHSIRLPLFLCPSDLQQAGATNYRANMGIGPGLFPRLPGQHGFPGNGGGAFVHASPVSPASFRDGLTNTILFSEKLIGDGDAKSYTPQTDFHFVIGSTMDSADDAIQMCNAPISEEPVHASYCGWTWFFGGWNSTWYNHVTTPNSRVPDCSQGTFAMAGGGSGSYTARSFHFGGVNAVMADGSARFFSDSIDLAVWRSLSTRASADNDSTEW